MRYRGEEIYMGWGRKRGVANERGMERGIEGS